MAADESKLGTDSVLDALQRAVNDQARILHQQQLLIRQLQEELRGVRSDGAESES